MTLPLIPLFGVLAILGLAIYRLVIFPAFISPLSKVPAAHWSASISPLWILWIRFRVTENRTLHAAHEKLGSVIRVGPSELSVNDLDGLRTVYAGGFEKGQWYSIFDNYGVPCMFSSLHSRTHSARKRMISHIYSKSAVHGSAPGHAQAENILYGRLLPLIYTSLGKSFDIHEVWNATTMDFITAYLFGLRSGANFLQNPEERKRWLHLYHARKTYPYFTQELPRLTRFCKMLGIHLVPKWVDDANDELEAWTRAHCEQAMQFMENTPSSQRKVEDEPVVLGTLLSAIKKEESIKGRDSVLAETTLRFQDLSIASEMIDHLAAGHETSGITMTYLSYHLSKHSDVQDELRKELLTLSPSMSLTNPLHEIPASKDIDALPYLQAVIMETLRLNAAIPGGQPRQTPFPTSTIGKFSNIPGGTRIAAQAHSIHRSPAVYPNPDCWDVTRWLDDRNGYTEEQSRERDRWFWAFGSGGRMCVGSNFAIHEIKLIVAAVYTNFKSFVVDDTGIEQEDGYTTGPASNRLVLKFEPVERFST